MALANLTQKAKKEDEVNRRYSEKKRVSGGKEHMRRYNLQIPESVYAEIKEIAEENGVTIVDVFRKFIKLGFIAHNAEHSDDIELIIREKGETEKRIVLL